MAYDEDVAARVRMALRHRKDITEKKMFGGLAFLLDGNMCCGVQADFMRLRLGEAGTEAARGQAHTRPMDFTGKPLKTMVCLDPPAFAADADLKSWVDRAVAFGRTLPAK